MTDTFTSSPGNHPDQDPLRHGAAAFIGEVLGINDAPDYLANDLSPIKRDANASIFTIQLDSSVGPAAFLVYGYLLHDRGGDGRTGKELFDTGLATLRKAAQLETPGPRAVAHAETDDFGFILATTPGTYRALTGEGDVGQSLEASPADLMATEEAMRMRSRLAQDLLHTLREANAKAAEWLQAIQAASLDDNPGAEPEALLEFTEDETELALYLLDDDSISSMLRALNLLVSTAQQHTSQALDTDPAI
jgi:hypothetical protein